ncbi:PREDICTED: rotatin [Nicrophorus vespilloides]|uniref:Rotatin n=1 Tax=Nicrophorus vespilloides TaxID=110193 RepID=A0ABM1MZK2_NICVS|nr:PREDICTED: rotatin [Nicrophorus vespilloides]
MHTFEDHVLNDVDYIINVLLSHKLDDIKLEAYKLCHKRIIATVGAKLNVSKCSAPGSQILFLLRPKVLLEIITHGIVDLIPEVQNYAEDILLHIIKSKILVSDDIWQRTVEALVPNIPILLCHANKSNLGRTIMNLLDPDRSRNLNIPLCEIIRGNVGLLFCENSHIREEAVSRLCWILTSTKEENRDLLPRINNLHDRGLGFVCCVEKAIDYNKYKATQHFYQPSSLCQVMELLSSKNVEPVIRRSAITQVSVMMEDPMLHRTFLDRNGVNLLKAIMEAALTEDNYKDYPDSVIPSISILKNICLYNACVRQELSYDIDAYHFILRALFMFFTEERVKQDGSILLHLMVNASFVLGNPIKSDLSLPQIILNKIKSPFHCHAHWNTSENCLDSLNDLLSDRWTLITLQIHWNIEWFGGLEKLVELDRVTYSRNDNFDDVLKLKNNDLLSIKSTCLSHCMKQHLYCIQLAESHEVIKDQLNNLTNCVNLYTLLKDDILEDLLSMPWEKTFEKFLNTPPSSPEDNLILAQVFQFLTLLVPTLKGISGFAWIQGILKNRNHMICDLLSSEEPKEPDTKLLMHGLLDLIITCVCAEQNYLDFHIVNREDANESGSQTWSFLVEIIAEHLKFNDAQHFYNLAYLDHLLSALVHLTSHLGWSRSKPKEIANKLLEQLSLGLFEMIGAFHCGKGSSAADSLMGLSITKHLVLILNHLLGEVQHMHVKNWEEMFLGNDINGQSTLASLGALQLSRDVILRAAILHFFAGIAVSPKTVTYLVNEVTVRGMNIWESNILIVLDHEEASVVKENAAMLMTNLISHVTNKDDDCQFLSNIFPSTSRTNLTNGIKVMYDLLDGHSFFKELEITLKGLYLDKHFYSYDPTNFVLAGYQTSRNVINSSRSASSAKSSFVSTPSFIKTICMFIYNITRLSPQDGCSILQDYGLFRLFLRCISMPHSDIETTKDLALYCDIIEMNTSILQLVTFSVSKNYSCLIATCNTRDCLTTIVSLLNPKLYYVTLPQLLYLRNKMWSAIYNLIEVILENCRNEDGVKSMDAVAVLSAIISEKKQETFIQSLCESMSCRLSNDLQLSAMSSFTSLLRLDSEQESNESSSMQNLLDFTKTPRSFSEEVLEMPKKDNKLTVLQTVYFSSGGDATVEYPPDTSEMAGAELCKILLNMYDFVTLKNTSTVGKKRIVITNALMSLLSISSEAKMYALRNGFLLKLVTQLKEIYVKLSLESVECLRRVADKKRVCPVLKELELVLSLFTNFMGGQEKVKIQAVHFGLADTCHKLWIWFSVQKHLMVHAMKMLCTFTTKCPIACQSLTLTSPVAGSGPRKVTSNMCLLQAICTMVGKEMEMISKTHDLTLLQLSFHLLHNSLDIVDCRIALSKNNFLQTVTRLHPAITKRQKPWESIETLWLEFLNEFTSYVEGQTCVAKLTEVFELLMTFASSSRGNNKRLALEVLKNISFYQPNRPRLLTSGNVSMFHSLSFTFLINCFTQMLLSIYSPAS